MSAEEVEDSISDTQPLRIALGIVKQHLRRVLESVEPVDCVVQGHLEAAEMALEMARELLGE